MLDKFPLLVFDWDGTLMDSADQIVLCMRAAISDCDLDEKNDYEIRNIIGLGLREAIETLYPGSQQEVHTALVDRYRYHFLSGDVSPSSMFDGAFELLEKLNARGHFLAIATGKGRNGLDRVLKDTGCETLIHASRCADETRSKPHPQMLEEIIDTFGVTPEDTLMIGDTEYDLQMAKNAGATSLAVCYGVHDRSRLLAQKPMDCVESVTELSCWLNV